LNTEGFFVGVFKTSEFEEKEEFLEKGDRILFYTDGVIEAKNSNHEEFGETRLRKMYREGSGADIPQLLENIEHAVEEFTQHTIEDDIAMVILEIE
jgi:sigma-B regulation protein RsbU (phosphoserine phosphatase)